MKDAIKRRLLHAALALSVGAAGGVATHYASQPSPAVVLAMELGSHFESSGRHIGTPYVDRIGKGQPLTVCNGITGPEVVAGRTYTPDDCRRLELPRYQAAERAARQLFTHWPSYNPWVQASIIDMIYNLGAPALDGSTLQRLANAGDLTGACQQMPRWVRGTVNGQKVTLPGLVDRRDTTRELCAEWGRTGHFSAHLLEAKK
ncbi:MAG: glycoside hydrolase family protein [Giesbergeria sp.]|jgi:lysozyme|nr:glycoside hydrolase family protein [Giesbergeria sp.]